MTRPTRRVGTARRNVAHARLLAFLLSAGTGITGCSGSSSSGGPPVMPPPASVTAEVVRFEVDNAAANVGDMVTFEWVTAGNTGAACELDVQGDGQVDYQIASCLGLNELQHTFSTAGDYQARLVVTNTNGQSDAFDINATVTSAAISASFSEPAVNQKVGGFVAVRVTTNSAAPLTDVFATLDGEDYPLWTITHNQFMRSIPVPTSLSGPVILAIRSTNSNGDLAVGYRTIETRGAARINVASPINYDLADPELLIEADCEQCSELRVETVTMFGAASPFLSGTTSVSTTVDLSANTQTYSLNTSAIRFIAVSDDGTEIEQDYVIYHQASSPNHLDKVQVPGNIIVADGERLVFIPADGKLRLLNKTTGEDTALPLPFGHVALEANAALTDNAIVYFSVARTPGAGPNQLSIVQGDTLNAAPLLAGSAGLTATVKGNYIGIKDKLVNGVDYGLLLYDIATDSTTTVSTAGSVENFDVGTDGTVIFTRLNDNKVYTWKAGTTTPLPGVLFHRQIRDVATSDGTLFAYWQDQTLNQTPPVYTHDGTQIVGSVGRDGDEDPEWTMVNNHVLYKGEFGNPHPNSEFYLLAPDGTMSYVGGDSDAFQIELGFTGCAGGPPAPGTPCLPSDDVEIFFVNIEDVGDPTFLTETLDRSYQNRGLRGKLANYRGEWFRYIGSVHYRLAL